MPKLIYKLGVLPPTQSTSQIRLRTFDKALLILEMISLVCPLATYSQTMMLENISAARVADPGK